MSSILYVEVKENREDTLTFLLVEIQHGYVFCESPTLALQLLLESWQSMMHGRLSSAMQARSHGGFYCPFSAEEVRARAERSPIREVCPEPFLEQAFVEQNAPHIIHSTEVLETRYLQGLRGAPIPGRHYFAPHGECLFRIRVTEPRWLDHLEPGVCWDTTAFPYERG